MSRRFITFEGAEGCGKTTHIRLLAEKLRATGAEVVTTREPGGTPLCETIRGLLQYDCGGETPCVTAETLLFLASRAQLISTVIIPALERGCWVLCDRFFDSTFAYQGYGRGYDLSGIRAANAFAINGLVPTLTLLLDTSEETGAARLSERAAPADRFEREDRAFHSRLRDGFRKLASAEPERFRVISTECDIPQSASKIWQAVCEKFSL